MRKIIAANDAVVNQAADVNYIPTPNGYQKSVYDHWSAHDGVFLDKKVLPLLLETIKKDALSIMLQLSNIWMIDGIEAIIAMFLEKTILSNVSISIYYSF